MSERTVLAQLRRCYAHTINDMEDNFDRQAMKAGHARERPERFGHASEPPERTGHASERPERIGQRGGVTRR